jgi:hypothetical protein
MWDDAMALANPATLLTNQQVLITGGADENATAFASAELYDPAKGIFTATDSMSVARSAHTATLLPNGEVLIAGAGSFPKMSAPADLYR